MFILDTPEIPTTVAALTSAIDTSLRKWIELPGNISPIAAAGTLPRLTALAIDVSQGKIEPENAIPFQPPTGALIPGPTIDNFTIAGRPIVISGIPVQLDLAASKAAFAYARTPDHKLIATLQDASEGELHLELLQADLNAAALQIAKRFAGNSVSIQSVNVALTSVSPTEVNVLLTITAKKFVSAIVKVSGQLAIDNQMIATARNLKAAAEGMVGNIAAGLLQPQLQKLEGQPLPLLAFSLGKVKLRGVQIRTTTGLQISSRFGSEPA